MATIMTMPERTVPMPEISATAKQDVFFVVLAEMIEGSIQRMEEEHPELMRFMERGEALGR
jgi:hypothetical protein